MSKLWGFQADFYLVLCCIIANRLLHTNNSRSLQKCHAFCASVQDLFVNNCLPISTCEKSTCPKSFDILQYKWVMRYARQKQLAFLMQKWTGNALIEKSSDAHQARHWRARNLVWIAFKQFETNASNFKSKVYTAKHFQEKLLSARVFNHWLWILIDQHTIPTRGCRTSQCLNRNHTLHCVESLSIWRAQKHANLLIDSWSDSLQTLRVLKFTFDWWVACLGNNVQDQINKFNTRHLKILATHSFCSWRKLVFMKHRQKKLLDAYYDKHAHKILRRATDWWDMYSHRKSVHQTAVHRAANQRTKKLLTRSMQRWAYAHKLNSRELVISKLCSHVAVRAVVQKAYIAWKTFTATHAQDAEIAELIKLKKKSNIWKQWIERTKRSKIKNILIQRNNLIAHHFWVNGVLRAWMHSDYADMEHISQFVSECQDKLIKRKFLATMKSAAQESKQAEQEDKGYLLYVCMKNWTHCVSISKNAEEKLEYILNHYSLITKAKTFWSWKSNTEHNMLGREQKVSMAERVTNKRKVALVLRAFSTLIQKKREKTAYQKDHDLSLLYQVLSSWRNVSYCAFHEHSRDLLLSIRQTFLSQSNPKASSIIARSSPTPPASSPPSMIPLPPGTRQWVHQASSLISPNKNPPLT